MPCIEYFPCHDDDVMRMPYLIQPARQTDRQTDRHTDTHTDRPTDRHTDRHTVLVSCLRVS